MKYTLRIPAAEQYAYIETEFEGEAEDAIEEYRRLTKSMTGGSGLEPKEFNAFLDEYLEHDSINADPGIVEKMNLEQSDLIQTIKRSRTRIKNRNS